MNPDLAFIVIDKDGHEFNIYSNGKIEGFGEGCKIVNYIPILIRQHSNMVRMEHNIAPITGIRPVLEDAPEASLPEPSQESR